IAGLAVHRLLTEFGVRPDMAGGHSYGELVALCAAEVFGDEDLITLSAVRAEAILAAVGEHGTDPGTMAVVAATPDEVRAALAAIPGVVIANHNGPRQVVLAGTTPAVDAALAALAERGHTTTRLPVACGFHSPLVAGAAALLGTELAGRDLRPPTFPVWSNATAAPYDTEPDQLRALLAR
ncbi:ACP S-malonyltransferase, partial [Longimycelium tulufanense]|uniref:ACP S-malonyltransferase n=1 Tax=Longimycelium tulufanense TaxID=907463 RepID=UPI00166EE3C8